MYGSGWVGLLADTGGSLPLAAGLLWGVARGLLMVAGLLFALYLAAGVLLLSLSILMRLSAATSGQNVGRALTAPALVLVAGLAVLVTKTGVLPAGSF